MDGQGFRHYLGLGVKKCAWSANEDLLLTHYVNEHGEGNWHLIPKMTGLNRCRKSCRLRWLNYLSPRIKRGTFASDEIDLIVGLQKLLGNRWSLIANKMKGRTANDVKNFWYTNLKKIQKSTSFNEKVEIIPKLGTTSKVEVIKPQIRTLKNKSVMIETQPDEIDDDALNQRKIAAYQDLSKSTLFEYEEDNRSSVWSLKSPSNQIGANILNEENSFHQRDDYWRQYWTAFNWETACVEGDNIDLGEETLSPVNNDWDDIWENLDIWNLLNDD